MSTFFIDLEVTSIVGLNIVANSKEEAIQIARSVIDEKPAVKCGLAYHKNVIVQDAMAKSIKIMDD